MSPLIGAFHVDCIPVRMHGQGARAKLATCGPPTHLDPLSFELRNGFSAMNRTLSALLQARGRARKEIERVRSRLV